MSAKKIIGCCIAGAAVCGAAAIAIKIAKDILEEKEYVNIRNHNHEDDDEEDDEWDDNIAEEF